MTRKARIMVVFSVIVLAMVVSPCNAGLWVAPNSFDVNTVEGTVLEETLTLGNSGDSELNFTLRTREVSREIAGTSSSGERGYVATVGATKKDKIVLKYEFDRPIVSKGVEYDLVQIEGLEPYECTGAPIVPVCPVTVLIPFGKKVVGSRVIALDTRQLPGTYRLPPAQRPYPLSYRGTVKRTEPDPAIYNQALPWPGIEYKEVGTQYKRGYQLFTVNLFPVQYISATGKLTHSTKLRLEIDLADADLTSVLAPTKKTKNRLRKMVDNVSALGSYPSEGSPVGRLDGVSALLGGGPYQYVIITNSALEASPGPWNFQALRDYKIAHGMPATIVTTEWIYANYSGTRPDGDSDNQTRIRNFLIDAYQTWGTEYVLLGGTNGIVPARKFWVEAWPGGDITTMPVDMYYGCVEPSACTFDYDSDGRYGEPTDGVGGGDVDLYAEIYVGRALVENATELKHFISKTLTYASTYSEYLTRIAMLGEHLGFGGVSEYAKDSMEQIRLGGEYDSYFTYGFENHTQPDYYDFNTVGCLPENPSWCWPLYDKDYDWPKSDLIDLMNGGVHVFNHLGHANYTYDMKLSTSDLTSLANTDYFFAYSQGCMPGGFDTTNCFAEVITSMEYGAFAVVMNARYGWGRHNSTDGPSQRFARQFWDATLAEDMLEMGRANQDSKEDNLWDINGECIRWCYYELNLFGDPEQQFRFKQACEWLITEPQEGTIGPGSAVDVNVIFDALELLPGTYGAEIIITSNAPCSPMIIPVTLTVSPDDLQIVPAEGFESNGIRYGPFTPRCKTYTLTNNGLASVNWTTSQTESWLSVEPNAGVLDPSDSINVGVCITSDANLLDPNIYDQVLIFENINSGSIKPRSVTLTVKPPDCFTEFFDGNDSDLEDLEGLMLTFSPDGSGAYYEACREEVNEFPTDPNGGWPVSLGDDDFAQVIMWLPWRKVLFYGERYNRFYIGSNGYITFGDGDTEYSASLENHFSMPRISGVFTDLTPPDEQCVSYKKLSDRVVVTFQDVPPYGDKTAMNSFQIEMFYVDGTIRITWLDIAATSGVAGLSEGCGLPPFFLESDLSEYVPCWPWCDLNKDYYVNFKDFAIFAKHWLDEDCDVPYWCGKSDIDLSSAVDYDDLSICAENWLVADEWWLRPVSHWKFDEGEGDIAYDSAGDNDGTIYGATWTTGQISGALDFDGVDDYVDCGDDSSLEPDSFTISAWINPGNVSSQQHIAGKLGQEPEDNCGYGYRLEIRGNGKASLSLDPWGCGNGNPLDSTTSLQLGQWYFVTGTYDGSTAKIYLNGEPENSGARTLDAYYTNFYIGAHYSDYHNAFYDHFNGKIDDVRVYDRALSTEEIWQLYQDGLGPKARQPNPADGASVVDPNVILNWSPGKDAASHDVYFGTDYDDVNDANTGSPEYKGNFDVNSYDPCGLDLLTTYYWRIDEVKGPNMWKGDVWSFKTWLKPNFVGWWKFDEGEGDIAYDSAGDNDGAIYGATWTSGQIEGALDFDGEDDYIDCGSHSSLDITGPITIGAWVKPNFETDGIIAGKTNGDSVTAGYGLFSYREGLEFNFYSGGWRRTTPRVTTTPNEWHYVVGTFDGNTAYLYVDGEQRASLGYTGAITSATGYPFHISFWRPRLPSYFDGLIDDVFVYNRALSAEEIWQLYQEGRGNKAFNPNPLDGATRVDPNTILSWSPVKDAASHDVYLGTAFDDVNDANTGSPEYKGNYDVNTFDPCGLDLDTTYYWRIDEINSSGTAKGDVWSFMTWVEPNLVSWWKFDEGSGTIAYDSAGNNDGTVYGAMWTTGQIDGALGFDGVNDYVGLSSFTVNTNNGTISLWFETSADFSANYGGMGYLISLDNQYYSYLTVGGDGTVPYWIIGETDSQDDYFVAAEGAAPVGTWDHVVVSFGNKQAKTYINGELIQTEAVTNSSLTLNRIGGRTQEYFNGKIDDVRIYDRALSAEEIWQLYHEGLGHKAFSPNPANGARGANPNVVLSWSPGKDAVSHDVYFGMDYDDVNDANTDSPEYKGNFDVNSYDPCGLDLMITYYWRIDEVNGPHIWKGGIWSFTTWIEPNFIGWWRFDKGEGDIAYDSAGDNDGTIYGATWTTGQIGGALDFDGIDDYVEIGDEPEFNFGADIDFSVCAWVKPTGNVSVMRIVDKMRAGHRPCIGFEIRTILSGYIIAGVEDNEDDRVVVTTTSSLTEGNWQFIAAVADRDGNLQIYYNGNLEDSDSLAPVGNINIDVPLAVGRSMDYDDQYFDGVIDDVRVYNRALTTGEIWQLYQDGLNSQNQ